jgi:hypothetical protein
MTMQNKSTPAEGKDSAQLEAKSALRGAACSPSVSDTPETDALRNLYENHEHRATVGDVWDLCESLERERNSLMGDKVRLDEWAGKMDKIQECVTRLDACADRYEDTRQAIADLAAILHENA